MKFENIEVGMKLRHKESGDIFVVRKKMLNSFLLDKYFLDIDETEWVLLASSDAKLFRKYKGGYEANSN